QRRWRVWVLKAQVTHILSRDAKGRGLSGIGCTFTSCRGSGCILVVVSHWPLGPSYLVGEAIRKPGPRKLRVWLSLLPPGHKVWGSIPDLAACFVAFRTGKPAPLFPETL